MLKSGTRLGSYDVISPLGSGGMGEVYRAHDSNLDRDVAIKVLPAGTADDPESRERLRREAMAAAGLDHPYICKVFEIREHKGTVFFVMEYIDGDTLQHRLETGQVQTGEALHLAGEIADALAFAHQRGIIHRDLKPANIMLTRQGHVKIMDFGLAKRLAEPAAANAATIAGPTQLTVAGGVLGTADYMSPEQAKGLRLDQRSDLFSFGVILAEMCGGQHPFRRASTAETFSAVLREPPTIRSGVPRRVRDLLHRLLAKEPAERYPSADDVRAELTQLVTAEASGALTAVDDVPGRHAMRPMAIAVLAVTVVAIAGYFALRSGLLQRSAPTAAPAATSTEIRSIAVLPLDNYSGDPGQDYFAEGMTDELTADLATVSRLRVISRGSAMQFKGDRRPPTPEIAKLLNVDAVVEGSVVRSGDRVRITAQLIDARADRHVWAHTFERSSRDVLALQGELAAAIAHEINVQVSPAEQSRLATARMVNPEAHDAYLKGRYFFNRPSDDNLKRAIEYFEQAAALSPDFVPAYSGLSDAYLWAGYNEGFITASEGRRKARESAERAVQLDDSSAEAHTSLAVFKLFYEYDWSGSEREFRRALSINPNYAFAHDQFGMALAFQGRIDEAITEGRLASELDPLSPQIPIDASMAFIFRGNYEEATRLAKRAAELDPTYFFGPMLEAWVQAEAGRPAQAIDGFKKAKAMGGPTFVSAWLAYAYGASGDRASAMAALQDIEKQSLGGNVTPFNRAMVSLGLGDRARAVESLEQAYAADSQWLGWLKLDRVFDPLRKEPRFIALVQKIGLR